MEKDELQSALEEAESALEQEENKVLRAQMDLAQAKQEIERRLQEKEEEFENTRKNFARALDSMQASLDGEMKAKEEVKNFILKGVFSKPSGDCIVAPNFLFFELETSNFGYLLIFLILFDYAKFQKDLY